VAISSIVTTPEFALSAWSPASCNAAHFASLTLNPHLVFWLVGVVKIANIGAKKYS